MQLTKDDVKYEHIVTGQKIIVLKRLDFSKFQQVVAFYEKYKNLPVSLQADYPEIHKQREEDMENDSKYMSVRDTLDMYADINLYNDWLFSYCFKDGLK